ncbi:MAG: nucleotidyl transferase AbiEii/AbiGii toxin family protein [Elusimicrobia bacterium]|nr:nucleotidyl transferase AbiEii/AbiGii toxin family protein [Elusimicrobiota bacterium]
MGDQPDLSLARRVLPAPLLRALQHVFAQGLPGCMLVGGTALAGFYAGHRRSDDLDLFTETGEDQSAAVLAVRSLERLEAAVEVRQNSEMYFRALCRLEGHRFTVDVAAAPHLFRIGRGIELPGGIRVAEPDTLLALKAAAIVSRCAEKDLFDLFWLLERKPGFTVKDLLVVAQRFDAGATAENMLLSLLGAKLDKESCDFSLDPKLGPGKIHRRLSRFKTELSRALRAAAKEGPPEPLAELVRRIRLLAA